MGKCWVWGRNGTTKSSICKFFACIYGRNVFSEVRVIPNEDNFYEISLDEEAPKPEAAITPKGKPGDDENKLMTK